MLNWLWKLLKPKSSVYEVTGIVRHRTVVVRYWKDATSEDGEFEHRMVDVNITNLAPPINGDHLMLKHYATALAARAELSAVEVLWADDPDRKGVVVYRDWRAA